MSNTIKTAEEIINRLKSVLGYSLDSIGNEQIVECHLPVFLIKEIKEWEPQPSKDKWSDLDMLQFAGWFNNSDYTVDEDSGEYFKMDFRFNAPIEYNHVEGSDILNKFKELKTPAAQKEEPVHLRSDYTRGWDDCTKAWLNAEERAKRLAPIFDEKEEPFLIDQQQFQELTHDEKEEYRAQFKPQKEEPKEVYSMEEMKEFTRKSVEYIEAKAKFLKDQGDILDEEGELKTEYRNMYDYLTKAYNEAVTEIADLKSQIATLKAETFSRGHFDKLLEAVKFVKNILDNNGTVIKGSRAHLKLDLALLNDYIANNNLKKC